MAATSYSVLTGSIRARGRRDIGVAAGVRAFFAAGVTGSIRSSLGSRECRITTARRDRRAVRLPVVEPMAWIKGRLVALVPSIKPPGGYQNRETSWQAKAINPLWGARSAPLLHQGRATLMRVAEVFTPLTTDRNDGKDGHRRHHHRRHHHRRWWDDRARCWRDQDWWDED